MTSAVVVGLLVTVGCSSEESAAPAQEPSPAPSHSASTGRTPDLQARPTEQRPPPDAPWTVELSLAGGVPQARRATLQRSVSAPVRQWADAAYVEARYPTDAFPRSFASWSGSAAAQAKDQLGTTTMGTLGNRLTDVVVGRRDLRVSVFAPRGRPSGATCRITMRLAGRDRAGKRVVVRVAGSLDLTPTERGWKVFGYDLTRRVAS